MANITIKNPAEYDNKVRKLETTDKAHADIFNGIFEKLVNNQEFLKLITDEAVKHMETSEIHVTTENKRYWDDKAETSTATQSENGLMSNIDKTKLDHIADKAEVNQNAISSVNAGGSVIEANGKTAQIAILSGSDNVTVTGDNATKQVKIAVSGGNADTLGGRVASDLSVNYANSAGNANNLEGHTAAQILQLGGKHLAGQGPSGGYSFLGDGAEDTGIFSNSDGDLYLLRNGVRIDLPANGTIPNTAGTIANATNADTVDGKHASAFSTATNLLNGSGYKSIKAGIGSEVSGQDSVSIGNGTKVSGAQSAAFCLGTQTTGWCCFSIGKYNIDPSSGNTFHSPFIIGRGLNDANRANAFRIYGTGVVYAQGAYNTGGADYAEYFEWLDKNKESQDRVGYFVTLDGDKIKIANSEDDYILGIISATPSVVGNSYDDQWEGRELKDEWGRVVYEEVELPEELDEEGNIIIEARKEMQPKINPAYDNSKKYIGRSQRREWSAVGMLGQLLVRDDGTCQVDRYCKCGEGGIATAAETGYRVLARVSDNIIRILFR